MVLERPPVEKKLAKIEVLKVESDYLIHPLKEVRTCGCPIDVMLLVRSFVFFVVRSDDIYSFPVGAIHADN
jgi:hypothetical protein